MRSSENRQYLLARRPDGLPKTTDWTFVANPLPVLANGEVLIRNHYISLDPGMRGMLNEGDAYIESVAPGQVMWALTVSEVIESKYPQLSQGDFVTGVGGVQDFAACSGNALTKIDPSLGPLPLFLSLLGTTSMVAYFGLLKVGNPQKGETVVVSAASGAVGSIVGQIAKIKGCKVIGIAGGFEKCTYLINELGFDGAIDYKAGDMRRKLEYLCPNGVDVYFDNVGGEVLDTVLTQINLRARIVLCGAISQYNAQEPVPGPGNYLSLLVNRARMEGVLFTDYLADFGEAAGDLLLWYAEGKLKSKETVVEGLEQFPQAFLSLFGSKGVGKLILKV